MKHSVVLLALSLLAGPAAAHDLWLDAPGGVWALHYGHLEAGQDHGPTALPLPDGWILGARGLDAGGQPFVVQADSARSRRWPEGAVALLVRTRSGIWTRSTQGTRNLPPGEVQHPLGSWRSVESVKGLLRWLPALARPLGGDFELVPTENPLAMKPGDKLTLLATRHGEALSGVTVAYEGSPRGITDVQGHINIRLRHAGLQLIQASLETPRPDDVADTLIETTALSFTLGEGQR